MEGIEDMWEGPLVFAFFKERRMELSSTGYTILKAFADRLRVDSTAQSIIATPLMFDEEPSLEALFDYRMSYFPGEEVLKNPEKRDLWSRILNSAVESIDEVARDREIGRYTSTRKILIRVV